MIDKKKVQQQLDAIQSRLDDKKNYSTYGETAFESGELYGMRNALAWVMGERVASPVQCLGQPPAERKERE